MTLPTIVIIPGNGGSHIDTDHWYAWLRDSLKESGYPVVASDMPDPELARREYWEPYITRELVQEENTIIVGHSSGAVAALRYLENHKLLGAILVGCNYTHLEDPSEMQSGWYDSPWQWSDIKRNAGWIVQFASADDPYIPMTEVEHIHQMLASDLRELPGRGHFMTDHNPANSMFPEALELIVARTQSI